VIVILYFGLRFVARGCTGTGCDWFIPLSLLLPLLAISLVLITGVIGVQLAQGGWRRLLGAATAVSFLGPFLALAIWRDQPDLFVPTATVLLVVLPLAALVFTFKGSA
jgi:hypothetical protein